MCACLPTSCCVLNCLLFITTHDVIIIFTDCQDSVKFYCLQYKCVYCYYGYCCYSPIQPHPLQISIACHKVAHRILKQVNSLIPITEVILTVIVIIHKTSNILGIIRHTFRSKNANIRGGEPGGAEGAIAPPLCNVGGRAPSLFTMFNRLLLIK